MAECIPKAPERAQRPWISVVTFEMIQHRRHLAEAGLVKDARAMGKAIRGNARGARRYGQRRA